MKTLPYKFSYHVMLAAICIVCTVACKKKVDSNFEPDRMFMPGDITVTSGETAAVFKWDASLFTAGKGAKYTLEISSDSTFKTTAAYSVVTDTTQVTVTDNQLAIKQKYFARVKANALSQSDESKWVYSSGFVPITGEQIFLPIADTGLLSNSVWLRWKITTGVSKITIAPATGSPFDVTLDATDVAAGQKQITALTPKATYTATIYAGTKEKGTITFTTPTDLPTGSNVVYVQATDDLATMIANATSGTMFVLLQGTKYTAETAIVIPDGVSFTIWGQLGPNKPILAFNGFTLSATAGIIKFENLDITGYQNADPTAQKRNYIFNQSAANLTTEIIFENCIIRNLTNSPLRLQSTNAITIGKVTVNKCIVYDIGVTATTGSYAFIHCAGTGVIAKFNNIILTNNTFYNIGYSLILHSVTPSQTVQVENNTLYNVAGDTRYIIDYNAQVISTSFTFNNNIVGKTLSAAATARGIRAGTAYSLSNCYKTSDAVFASGAITGITDYGKVSTELFTDPANGNFTIKDATFAGKSTSGDPRWRQ